MAKDLLKNEGSEVSKLKKSAQKLNERKDRKVIPRHDV